jgi:pimeloyl-ACP methyl ester carboxylesterase
MDAAKVLSPLGSRATREFFKNSDGLNLYYEDIEGSGPVLFFLYGLGCTIGHWKYLMADCWRQKQLGLADFRMIWMDYRGHGLSEKAEGQPVRLQQLAQDAVGLIHHLGIRKDVVYLGQSMGGNIALLAARENPSVCGGLVLQGTPPKGPSTTARLGPKIRRAWKSFAWLNHKNPAVVKSMYRAFPYLSGRTFHELVRFIGFNPRLVRRQDVEEYIQGLLACDPNVFWDLVYDLETFDSAKFGASIQAPILIMAGAKDNCVTMENAEYLADSLPTSRLVVMEHGSHCPHLDDPDQFNQRVAQFLTELRITGNSIPVSPDL